MKKEITVGLIVTVLGGVLVYWLTQGIQEERKSKQEAQQIAERDRNYFSSSVRTL